MARKKPLPEYQGYTKSETDSVPAWEEREELWTPNNEYHPTPLPDFIQDPNEIGPSTEEQFNYKNQFNRWNQDSIPESIPIIDQIKRRHLQRQKGQDFYIKREGGQILDSFKSAARFDQKTYKKNPGRRSKG